MVRDMVELHRSIGGEVHRVSLSRLIQRRSVGSRSCGSCRHSGSGSHGPRRVVRSGRLGVRKVLALIIIGWCHILGGLRSSRSVRRGYRAASRAAQHLRSVAVRTVDGHVRDVKIVA